MEQRIDLADGELQITQETPVIIYGAGALGEKLYKILSHYHYKVEGFVDKRYQEIEKFQGLSVWSVESCPIADDKLVIVAIKDVYVHDEIASGFAQRGTKYILYKPLSAVKGKDISETEKKISQVYEQLIGFKYMNLADVDLAQLGHVPAFQIRHRKWTDEGLIKREKDTVVAMIPVEMLFSAYAPKESATEWDNKPLLCLIGHTRLFDYFQGKGEDRTELYFSFCRAGAGGTEVYTSKAWEMSLLETRYHVWDEMQKMLEFSPDFFRDQPAEGRYHDEKKIFHLIGGRHRATFLLSKGYHHIPVRLRSADYEKYFNAETLRDVIEYMEEANVDTLEAPIPHPFFYHFPTRKASYVQAIIRPILEIIAEENLYKREVILQVNDQGALKRLLSQMGFCVRSENQMTKMEQLLDKLFYYENDVAEQTKEEICIVEDLIEGVENMGGCCREVFLFSDKKKCEELMNKKLFSHQKMISETFWMGKKIALVYMRK